jgi:tetratricopeptide (TPR) repeat protein
MRREFNYYLGVCLSRTGMNDDALKAYQASIEYCKQTDKEGEESPYYVFSVLGCGVIYEQQGNKQEAIKMYDQVLKMRDVENSRETAQKLKDNLLK